MTPTKNQNQSASAKSFDETAISLTMDFVRAALDDVQTLEGLPNGSMLILLPENDTEFIEKNIEIGLKALREGQNVVFRHVARIEGNTNPVAAIS